MLLLSIIIPSYNAKEYLDACFESIYSSNAKDFEIIFVDNGSTDNSVGFLRGKYKEKSNPLVIVELDKNYGPAKARNEGIKIAKGKYICFLDSDTVVHPDWSKDPIIEFKKDPKLGIVQCKLLLAKERNKIDYVGEYIGQNGFLVQRSPAGEIDKGQYDQRVEILAAKSAGMFIKKEILDKIKGFDDDYFIYVEETDLGWRSWLVGYKAIFIPESIVYHEFGTSSVILGKNINNYNAKFHGTKNYILTLSKNLSCSNLLKILPIHVFLWVGLAWYSLFKGKWKSFLWIHQGIIWNILNIRSTLNKRRYVQQNRKISDTELLGIFMKKMPFKYFVGKATIKQKIGNAESFSKINEEE